MDPKVIHNQEKARYEIWLGDERIGLADYEDQGGQLHFVHTEVNPEHQNNNYAAILIREAFEDIRKTGSHTVVPVCSYVVMYMKRHPESLDLLDPSINIDEAVAACRIPRRRD